MSENDPAKQASAGLTQLKQIDQISDEFEADWKAGRRPQIEEYLPRVAESARGELLGYLVSLDLDYRRRQGETPDTEEYTRRFPDHAAAVQQAYAHMQSMREDSTDPNRNGQLAETESRGVGSSNHGDDQLDDPRQIGRYKIQECLGQGAFGRVYRARDEELQRDVAIKISRPDRFISATPTSAPSMTRT